MAFSPVDDGLLASGHDNGTVKVWRIADSGGAEVLAADVLAPTATLVGHGKRVSTLRWHPATQVLASGGVDGKVLLWLPDEGRALAEYAGKDAVYCVAWHWDGATLAASGADKTITLFDRALAVTGTIAGHGGPKASAVAHLEGDLWVSCGFSAQRERQLAVASASQGKFVHTVGLDSNTGTMTVLYERNSRIVTLVSRGDSLVRMYELSEDVTKPKLTALTAYGESAVLLLAADLAPVRGREERGGVKGAALLTSFADACGGLRPL